VSEVELYLGDFRTYLSVLKNKNIHQVITDPPYGEKINKMGFINNQNGGVTLRNKYTGMADWDDKKLTKNDIDSIISIAPVSMMFGGNFYADMLPASRCWYIWDKKDGGKFTNDFADCEMAWTNIDAPSRVIRYIWHGMIQENMKDKEPRVHPTQKPIAVIAIVEVQP
jgi:DNA modification methylase